MPTFDTKAYMFWRGGVATYVVLRDRPTGCKNSYGHPVLISEESLNLNGNTWLIVSNNQKEIEIVFKYALILLLVKTSLPLYEN